MLAVLEHHEDALVLEDDLDEVDDVRVGELGAEGHFADGGLGDPRVLGGFAFFVGFESKEGVGILESNVELILSEGEDNGRDKELGMVDRETAKGDSLLDCKLLSITILPNGFVDPPIGTAADEADDFVFVEDVDFTCVVEATSRGLLRCVTRRGQT